MLTYEEAKQYVSDNFEVLDTREDENAVTYLAKKGEVRYLLHAMKRGGLVQDGIFLSFRCFWRWQHQPAGVRMK